MAPQGKVTGFRLPEECLIKLDDLKEKGLIRHRTDGVLSAIEVFYRYAIVYKEEMNIGNMFSFITGDTRISEDWDNLTENEKISIYLSYDMGFRMKKINEKHGIITQYKGNHEIIINVEIKERNVI